MESAQELLDGVENEEEVEKLEAKNLKLEKQLKAESEKRFTAEDEVREARKEVAKRDKLDGVLERYVCTLETLLAYIRMPMI